MCSNQVGPHELNQELQESSRSRGTSRSSLAEPPRVSINLSAKLLGEPDPRSPKAFSGSPTHSFSSRRGTGSSPSAVRRMGLILTRVPPWEVLLIDLPS